MVFMGLLAFVSYFLIGATSKEEFRNSFYEVFLFVHATFQILALGFLYFHHHNSRPYVLACTAIFIVDRIIFRLYTRSLQTTGEVTILEDQHTVRVTLTLPDSVPKKWNAGDHVFLSIPKVAYLHPHPFSIASPPPPHSSKMELLIRARAGFSKKLLESAAPVATGIPITFDVVVDGPYGSSFATQRLQGSDVALLVAGGSGIAVIYPLAYELAAASWESIPGDEEQGTRRDGALRKIVVVWIVHEDCHLSWLQGREHNLRKLEKIGIQVLIHVTKTEGKRPQMKEVIEGIVGVDGCELKRNTLGVVVCGPSGMVRDTRNSSAKLMRRGLNVGVVTEKFGW